jgi:hypothetical protein
VKFYGSLVMKGEPTEERPHRYARVLEIPNELGLVSALQISGIIAEAKPAPKVDRSPSQARIGNKIARGGGRWMPEMRAIAYLEKCDPAIQGNDGSGKTFGVACRVGPGFDLSEETTVRLLMDHYNETCQPPWSEKEIRHKVEDAFANEPERGWLLNADRNGQKSMSDGPGQEQQEQPEEPNGDELADRVSKVIESSGVEGLLKDEALLNDLARLDEAALAPIIAQLSKHRAFRVKGFRACLDKHRPKAKPTEGGAALRRPVYAIVDECLAFLDDEGESFVMTELANFSAKILVEEIRDDGEDQTRVYKIFGRTKDGLPLYADVEATEYESMGWVAKGFGPKAIINAGRKIKDHTRAAIQHLSGDISTRTIFTHTGWRRFGDEYAYLHAGGAIGADGLDPSVTVDLSEYGLGAYELPEPPEGDKLRAAVRASLGILKLGQHDRPGSRAAAALVLTQAYRSVLPPNRHTVQLSGITGTHKSCLAALSQQHFGPALDYNNLPAGYNSTTTALGVIRHRLADSLLTIDDFVPGGTRQDRAKADKEGEDILRSQGNGQGRCGRIPTGPSSGSVTRGRGSSRPARIGHRGRPRTCGRSASGSRRNARRRGRWGRSIAKS